MVYNDHMTTNTNTAPTAADAAEVTERLAATAVGGGPPPRAPPDGRRAAETGEPVEVAAARVLADFAARWPTVAVWVGAVTVGRVA